MLPYRRKVCRETVLFPDGGIVGIEAKPYPNWSASRSARFVVAVYSLKERKYTKRQFSVRKFGSVEAAWYSALRCYAHHLRISIRSDLYKALDAQLLSTINRAPEQTTRAKPIKLKDAQVDQQERLILSRIHAAHVDHAQPKQRFADLTLATGLSDNTLQLRLKSLYKKRHIMNPKNGFCLTKRGLHRIGKPA